MYEITIKKTVSVKKMADPAWAVLGKREVERETHLHLGDVNQPRTRIDDIYGYTPAIEKTVEVTHTLLHQQIESLDLGAVIKAVNDL